MNGITEINITVPEDFSLGRNLVYLSRSPDECLHKVEGNIVYKTLQIGDVTVLFSVTQDKDRLEIRTLNYKLFPEQEEYVKKYFSEWFDLSTDLNLFYKFAMSFTEIKKLADRYPGVRIMGIPDLFEALCWAVIGQQINLNFAYTLKKNLVESAGKRLSYNGYQLFTFPAPEDVLALTPDRLKAMQFSRQKAEYLLGLAELFAEGKLSKSRLAELKDYSRIKTELMKIRGIGEWSADYVIMRCLRNYNALPASDAGLINALKSEFELDEKPAPAEIKKIAVNWGEWKSYVVFYLWRSLIKESKN